MLLISYILRRDQDLNIILHLVVKYELFCRLFFDYAIQLVQEQLYEKDKKQKTYQNWGLVTSRSQLAGVNWDYCDR